MSSRAQKLSNLQVILDSCRTNEISYTTPAAADKIMFLVRPFGLGAITAKEYVRIIIDALSAEHRTGKEFRFATH